MQFDYFEKVTSRVFQQICCNFYHFKYTRCAKRSTPKTMYFYFKSDIATAVPSDIVVERR